VEFSIRKEFIDIGVERKVLIGYKENFIENFNQMD
jgi:hypothetical protein